MKKPIFCIGLALLTNVQLAQAQGALTVGAILAASDSVTGSLNGVVTTGGVTAQTVVNDATTQIDLLENQLRQDAHNDLTIPIQSLSVTAQNTANSLQMLVQQLNALLDKQRNCLDLDLNLFLAGVQTSVEQAKLGIPFVSTQGARLDHFVFAGHSLDVVPTDGGVMTVSGFKLWQSEAPKVSLSSSETGDHDIAVLQPGRQSDNDIVTTVPGDIVKANAGKCVFVRVEPMYSTGWFWPFKSVKADQPLVLPFCAPDDAQTQYSLGATNSYNCPSQRTYNQTSDVQLRDNAACEGQPGVSAIYPFAVPSTCRVIGAEPVRGGLTTREIGATSAAVAGNTVTLTGQLDTARCTSVGPIHHKHSNATWQYAAKATIQCDDSASAGVAQSSGWVKSDYPETNLCVDLAKSCIPPQSDVHVTVGRRVGSQQKKIYDKSGTATAATLDLGVATFGSTTTDATYTGGVSAGPARACAKVTVVACGY